MKQIALLIILATMHLTASAHEVRAGGLRYSLDTEQGTAAVISDIVHGINTYDGDIVVPAMVYCDGANYTVTSIAEGAFAGSGATLIQLPETVTHIGDRAFEGTRALEGITLPCRLNELGTRVLAGSAVQTVLVPEGVTAIGDSALAGCSQLHTLLLPGSLQSIGTHVLDGCYNLFEIYSAGTLPPTFRTADNVNAVDVIVPDTDAVSAYEQDSIWGDYDHFSLWAHDEDSYYDINIGSNDRWEENDNAGSMHSVALSGNVAFRVLDKWGEQVAMTAAPRYYLEQGELDEAYTIVPSVMLADLEPVEYVVPAARTTPPVSDEMYPLSRPHVYSMDGTIYIDNLQHDGWVRIYDVYGTLHLERPAAQVMNIGNLPPARVYIVVTGDYATKVSL